MSYRCHTLQISMIVLAMFLAGAASPATALDCSAADTLSCGVTGASYKLKDGIMTTGTVCGTSGYDTAILFVVVVDSLSTETFTTTSTPTGIIDLYLLASCDESDCVPGTSGGLNGAPLVADCVPPGTYFLAAVSLSNANATFDVTRACVSCVITPVEPTTWGSLKARYQ
jgi:hypothetical protein